MPGVSDGARTWPHETSRTGPRQARRTAQPPAVHSVADRTDAPAPMPAPYAATHKSSSFPCCLADAHVQMLMHGHGAARQSASPASRCDLQVEVLEADRVVPVHRGSNCSAKMR